MALFFYWFFFERKKNNMQVVPEILRDSIPSAPTPKKGHDSFHSPFFIGFFEEKK
jgi:hypothetical protein